MVAIEPKEIIILCDTDCYNTKHILQIVSKARVLADQCESKVTLIGTGKYSNEQLDHVTRFGIDNVILCEQHDFPAVRKYSSIVSEILKSRNPIALLTPASSYGKAVAATISARFGYGLTADCIDITVSAEGEFSFRRAAINDSVIANIKCLNSKIAMGTIKKDVFIEEECQEHRIKHIEEYVFKGDAIHNFFEVLHVEEYTQTPQIDIRNYKKVICIGRGVKSKRNVDRIYRIAEKLDAGVVGTRAVVEDQLLEPWRQVGQSGISISPQIYIGLGVSGASQHMVGLKNAGLVIAVNNNRDAAIFSYADYIVIEDINVIISEMERALFCDSTERDLWTAI